MYRRTPEKEPLAWVPRFLLELAKSPNVAGAARVAGVARSRAYTYRGENAAFAAGWDEALETATDDLVGRVWTRATKESDTLAIFLLKSHRPDVYARPENAVTRTVRIVTE